MKHRMGIRMLLVGIGAGIAAGLIWKLADPEFSVPSLLRGRDPGVGRALGWPRMALDRVRRWHQSRFRANEVRLLLGVVAYSLGSLLRWLVLPMAIQS